MANADNISIRPRKQQHVLVGCEYSGKVRDAFLARGHDAWSNDIIDTESKPERHLKCDIMQAIRSRKWDGIIIHIPCTAMAVCGNSTYGKCKPRHQERLDAVDWSIDVWEVAKEHADWVVMENPASVLFPELRNLGAEVQYVQPWMFGHPEQKKTGFALHNISPLVETDNVYEHMMTLPRNVRERIHFMPPSADRSKERARFFPGIAAAMADQWGAK